MIDANRNGTGAVQRHDCGFPSSIQSGLCAKHALDNRLSRFDRLSFRLKRTRGLLPQTPGALQNHLRKPVPNGWPDLF